MGWVRVGAACGIAYGVAELFVLALLPVVLSPAGEHQRFHAGFSAAIIALYALGGGLIGTLLPFRSFFAVTRCVWAVLLTTCGLVVISSALVGGPPKFRVPDRPRGAGPNVILISLDTVRADHLSVYGYGRNTSPNIEKFAAEATLYRTAVSTGDMTLTSHASIFTGLYGVRHGCHCNRDAPAGRPLADKFATLAEMLQARGYTTAAVVANTGYLGTNYNLHQGFDHYDVSGPSLLLEGAPRYLLRGLIADLALRWLPYSILNRWTRDAREINREARDLLPQLPSPFFLFVNYMDAHRPYVSPAPFRTMFPGRDWRFGQPNFRRVLDEVLSGKRAITAAERAHLTSQYDGAIAYLDSELGQLYDRLKQAGLYDNALIIVTSDHGEAFGERNLVEHGSSVYEDQVRVPLIIRYPDQRKAAVVDERTSGVDILPTVLDVLRVPLPETVDGRSLRQPVARPVLAESYAPGIVMTLHRRFRTPERALFLGNWKLIDSRTGSRELYDISADPAEKKNLYGMEAQLQREMEGILETFNLSAAKAPSEPLRPDPKTVERLRGLGYLQ